ncbi:hypothetical protein [Candidatus Thioglobus sp.]|uniref:hypothetical protein n=1 Tax=Candidatus Thioglobus sp. TaxID=2026721 RepID=UPI003D103A0C
MNEKIDKPNKFLPVWVWVVALIQIFLVLLFSIGTFINPADFIPGASELNYVTQLYITRNLVVALGIVAALCLRSHTALLLILMVRLLTDVSDVISVYALNVTAVKSSVPIVAVLLIIPALLAVGYLWQRIRQKNAH